MVVHSIAPVFQIPLFIASGVAVELVRLHVWSTEQHQPHQLTYLLMLQISGSLGMCFPEGIRGAAVKRQWSLEEMVAGIAVSILLIVSQLLIWKASRTAALPVLFSMSGLLSACLAHVFLGVRLAWRQWMGVLVSLSGLLILLAALLGTAMAGSSLTALACMLIGSSLQSASVLACECLLSRCAILPDQLSHLVGFYTILGSFLTIFATLEAPLSAYGAIMKLSYPLLLVLVLSCVHGHLFFHLLDTVGSVEASLWKDVVMAVYALSSACMFFSVDMHALMLMMLSVLLALGGAAGYKVWAIREIGQKPDAGKAQEMEVV